jgi:hypothetical protein
MSLLSLDKFDPNGRRNLLKEMTMFFFDKKIVPLESIGLVSTEFFIDSKSYFTVQRKTSDILEYLLRCFSFFCVDVKYRSADEAFYVMYHDKEYFIPQLIVHSFFYHQIYVNADDIYKVEKDWNQKILRSMELIPMRAAEKDGQMKIMIDAVLAVDAMLIEEREVKTKNFKILIIGSSHDPNVNPKFSYAPIEYMIQESEIHMYDVLEEEGVSQVGSNVIYRYRKAYDYKDLKKFDLVLDDSWSEGLPAIENKYMKGKDLRLIMPSHFSVKSFKIYLDYSIYFQIVKTSCYEVRCVSRPIIPSYETHRYLGTCAYCRELKFFLQQQYGDLVYEKILALHKTYECYPAEWYSKTKQIREQFQLIRPKWVELKQRDHPYRLTDRSIIINNEVVRRRIDDLLFPELYPVELRKEHLQHVSVIISDDEYLSFVMLSAKNIYKYVDDKLYIMERKAKEIYQVQETSVDYVIDRVKQMKYSEKARKEYNDHLKTQIAKGKLKQSSESDYDHNNPRIAFEQHRVKMKHEKQQRYREVYRPFEEV